LELTSGSVFKYNAGFTDGGELTGVEGVLLRVQVSRTLHSEHLDGVAGAWSQAVEAKGQIFSSKVAFRHVVAFGNLYPVMGDISRPGSPSENGAVRSLLSHVHFAKETICSGKSEGNCFIHVLSIKV